MLHRKFYTQFCIEWRIYPRSIKENTFSLLKRLNKWFYSNWFAFCVSLYCTRGQHCIIKTSACGTENIEWAECLLIPSYSTCSQIIPLNPLTSVKPHVVHRVCPMGLYRHILSTTPMSRTPRMKHTHTICAVLCWAVLFVSVSIISPTHCALATAATSAANINHNHGLEIIRAFWLWDSSLMLQWLGAAFVSASTKEEQWAYIWSYQWW